MHVLFEQILTYRNMYSKIDDVKKNYELFQNNMSCLSNGKMSTFLDSPRILEKNILFLKSSSRLRMLVRKKKGMPDSTDRGSGSCGKQPTGKSEVW